MVITLDGPAGAGKSTVARRLAERLGFDFLDTGAMYRAVAWAALHAGIDMSDAARLLTLAQSIRLEIGDRVVRVNDQDVSEAIREPSVTGQVHYVADHPGIRERLVELQRQIAQGRNIVTEGRDQGTVAFPAAECKIYLSASAEARAQRRVAELHAKGKPADFTEILAQQNERDERDSTRPVGRLQKARDAVEVSTDGLTVDQVVDRLESLVRSSLCVCN